VRQGKRNLYFKKCDVLKTLKWKKKIPKKTKQLIASQNKDNKKFKQNSRKKFQARTQSGAQVRLGPLYVRGDEGSTQKSLHNATSCPNSSLETLP
jgi:hypothetical protein